MNVSFFHGISGVNVSIAAITLMLSYDYLVNLCDYYVVIVGQRTPGLPGCIIGTRAAGFSSQSYVFQSLVAVHNIRDLDFSRQL
jgi:CRISPR/Cas system-associated endonuclease Cas1